MCLAVPGRLLSITGEDPLTRVGRVDFGGIVKEINLAFVPEARVDDYVLVHVGFALTVIDESEAVQVFEALREMGELLESEVGRASKGFA
ncbi:MAG: HypC/HybG/HupF family hydrogenase formation chaperone [Stellaceae bacterium]